MEKSMGFDQCRRLWIGNLDPNVTEYQLLKLAQKHGKIEKFDFLLHRTGLLAGRPRGYAFVTYTDINNAVVARDLLNNQVIGQKKITAMWAYDIDESTMTEKPKIEISIPVLELSKEERKSDRLSQIQAIEAKLKLMEHKEDELKINDTIASKPPLIKQFQYNKNRASIVKLKVKNEKFAKPYPKRKDI
ncbi:probable RNA-binding protein 18 [Cylas formicarius]|uniref:probable RNA-binding protein 18 n=1 Tax=Cylas formicarius TaxID=197179 RepID=UPI002958CA19|nr:probable RNA-binding protein 18 [Cylas formicarius]